MAFPDYSVLLDDFTGGDTTPIPNWTTVSGLADCNRTGGTMEGSTSWAGAYRGSYTDLEARFTFANALDNSLAFAYRYQDAGGASPIRDSRRRGYQWSFAGDGTVYSLTRMDDGGTGAALKTDVAWAGGAIALTDSIGVLVVGGSHKLFLKRGAGAWTEETGAAATDATYIGPGALMFQFPTGTDGGIDNLYASELLAVDSCLPDADITTTGWTTAPLFSKVNDSSDATVIQATAV